MKSLNILVIVIVLLIEAVPATAQDGIDYGTRVDVFTTFDYMAPVPDEELIYGSKWYILGRYYQIYLYKKEFALSPDGKWIAFTSSWDHGILSGNENIWIVPAEGGEVIFILGEEIINELYEIGEVFIDGYINPCFTPDSQEIMYYKYIYDESKGAIFYFNDDFELINCENGYPVIESVNINTGERRIVVEGGRSFSFSHDGRYLCYIHEDYMFYLDETKAHHHGVPTIYDTLTGETRYLSESTPLVYNSMAISPDNSYILVGEYDWANKRSKIYKVPFEGGEYEEFINMEDSGDRKKVKYMSFSPDGQWLLFRNRIKDPDTDKKDPHLFICNTSTGELHLLFGDNPPDYERHYSGKFTQDGERIYYIRDNTQMPVELQRELEDAQNIYFINFDSSNFLTHIESENENPLYYTVLNNYPNPFNLSTTIEFTIPERNFTELIIYDITGRNIRELLSRNIPAGVHSVIWDGRDENGIPVSSGVYISRLSSGKQVVSGKMIHIK